MTDGNPQQEAYFASTRGTGRPGKISQTPEQRYPGQIRDLLLVIAIGIWLPLVIFVVYRVTH